MAAMSHRATSIAPSAARIPAPAGASSAAPARHPAPSRRSAGSGHRRWRRGSPKLTPGASRATAAIAMSRWPGSSAGLAHHQEHVGGAGQRHPRLAAGHPVAVAVGLRAGGDGCRVRSGVRLGQREPAERLAGDQAPAPPVADRASCPRDCRRDRVVHREREGERRVRPAQLLEHAHAVGERQIEPSVCSRAEEAGQPRCRCHLSGVAAAPASHAGTPGAITSRASSRARRTASSAVTAGPIIRRGACHATRRLLTFGIRPDPQGEHRDAAERECRPVRRARGAGDRRRRRIRGGHDLDRAPPRRGLGGRTRGGAGRTCRRRPSCRGLCV